MTTRVRNNLSAPTRLVGALTSGATTINVDSTAGWPTPGGGEEALGCLSYPNVAALELFTYTGKTSTSFTGVTRGADDTDPKAHPSRALVVHVASAADISAAAGTLDALSDVSTAGAADGEVLTYDSGTSSWVPAAVAALPTLASGTYTPTATGVTNVDSITVNPCTYSRVGDIVTVAGFFSVNHTAGATATVMRLSLPIASNLVNQYDLGGACGAEDQLGGMVEADETNNEALFRWRAPTSASRFIGFMFQYPVL